MSFKGKTYSKKSSKAGNPFERMMKEQCNKPVAAKSAGIVGKWGATSFTSVRGPADQSSGAPKVKKFFKSRTENVSSQEPDVIPAVATVASAKIISAPDNRPQTKKIFRSKNVEEQPLEPVPPRATRQQRNQSSVDGYNATQRSPLQDKDWPSVPEVKHTSDPIKKLPVPRPKKSKAVPEENPMEKESRLLAMFNSQSKENQPSEGTRQRSSRSAKSVVPPQESQRRKAPEPEVEPSLPPIPKLKLSLSKKSASESDKYKVVKPSDVNNSSDSNLSSNGMKNKSKGIEQSDLDLLEGDFVSEAPRTRSVRQRSPPREAPPRKVPRKMQTEAELETKVAEDLAMIEEAPSASDDMFDMVMQSRPKRGSKKAVETVADNKLSKPSSSQDLFDQMLLDRNSSDDSGSKYEARSSRRRQVKPDQGPPVSDSSSFVPEESFPSRISASMPVTSKPTTYKKSIFKSRNKVVEEPKKAPSPTVSEDQIDAFSMEFDRVPPLPKIDSMFEPTPPPSAPSSQLSSSSSLPAPRSRNKFFKSKNKNTEPSQESKSSSSVYPMSSQSSLTSPPSSQSSLASSTLSRISSLESESSKKSASSVIRSPSPSDSIYFPARIATPVKETITKTTSGPVKKSIFKHKAKEKESKPLPKKAMSLYKHRMGWGGDKDEFKDANSRDNSDEDDTDTEPETGGAGDKIADDFDFDNESADVETDISFAPSKLTRVATYPTSNTGLDETGDLVTQVKCPKSYKGFYTVIKNVKTATEINDHGEFQEFTDDVEYICDGMKPRNKIAARCLAAISLAQKCMKPNFRMHLRAHGEVSKFFGELKDAPSNSSLALCTSTILFVLSQDRLNMDMDRESLELLLNLLDTDCNLKDALESSGFDKRELAKNKQKVIDICTEMKSKGHAGTLNLDMISADHLAMETLLSMTSKRAGEWFKEELRELGGLAHLARTFTDCVNYLTIKPITTWTDQLVEKLKKSNRILRVLENVSHENEENCGYLLEYGRSLETHEPDFVDTLQKLFKLLDEEVQLNPTTDMADKESVGVILRDSLFSVMRVHINMVHDYRNRAYGSLEVGQREGCMYRVLRCIFIMPYWFCPLSKRFEALVLSLTLLINMVEHSDENR